MGNFSEQTLPIWWSGSEDRELLFGMFSVLKLDSDLAGSLELLRCQWYSEPSVHGGKTTRARSRKLNS